MKRIAFRDVVRQAAMLWLGDENPGDEDANLLIVRINRRAREAWEKFWWPQWTLCDQWTLHPLWVENQGYDAGERVYFEPTRTYYEAKVNIWDGIVSPLIPPVVNGVPQLDYWIPLKMDYPLTFPIPDGTGEIKAVWTANPRKFGVRNKLKFKLTDKGMLVIGVSPAPWVEYRQETPSWHGKLYVLNTPYPSNSQVYYADDFWVATDDVDPSDIPGQATFTIYPTFPNGQPDLSVPTVVSSKWKRIDFPAIFKDAVAQAAFADMLRVDGQQEKFAVESAEAQRLLDNEFDKIERQQGQTIQLNMKVRY